MPARPLYPVLRVAAGLSCFSAIIWSTCGVPVAPPRDDVDDRPAWVDALGADALAWPMTGPLAGQKRPPCEPRLEVEQLRACWVTHTERPPCPRGTAEREGRCYLPVRAPPVPNQALEE